MKGLIKNMEEKPILSQVDISSKSLFDGDINNDWKNQVTKIDDLVREETPLISKVEIDEGTMRANNYFDFDFDGENKFYPFKISKLIQNLDFQILVITGASGSGKSTFSKYFGEEEELYWDNNKAIISNFNNVDEAIDKLGAVGLNSIPTWCKPRNVLSVGEGFRADLARRIKDNCVIDEFTSTVDRTVALSCSKSIGKYIRKKNLQKCVFVSCHKDFIDTLCPDYVIDLDDEAVYDTRGLLTRQFELQIYETTNKREIWNLFKQHHYLSADFNVAARLFVAYLDNKIVGMISVLPQPGVFNVKYTSFRIHRLVVLPDYQGLGIARKLLEYICDLYLYHNRHIYLRTSHIKLINYMLHSPKWQGDGKLIKSKEQQGLLHRVHVKDKERLSTSFKYVGPCEYVEGRNYDYLSFKEKMIDDKIFTTEKLF